MMTSLATIAAIFVFSALIGFIAYLLLRKQAKEIKKLKVGDMVDVGGPSSGEIIEINDDGFTILIKTNGNTLSKIKQNEVQ